MPRERLAALRELLILDTPPEERYDKIVQFAAQEFDVPVSAISLIDENRQWFKARVGVDMCEGAREDERFADNPLVTGPPHVIFYAGAPLRMPSGYVIGTLCLIGHEPRAPLDKTELAILSSLRDLTAQ